MGKIVLSVLAVIVVLFVFLLLYPFCYTIKAEGKEGKYSVKLNVYWLFGIIYFVTRFVDSFLNSKLKIFGITFFKDSTKIDLSKKKKKPVNKPIKKAKVKKRAATVKEYISICVNKIKRKIKKLILKIKDTYYDIKAKYIKWTSDETKEAVRGLKKTIIKVLKHIRPRKVNCNVRFGFEQPHLTGQALGGLVMFCELFRINPKSLKINPDFENKVFEGYVTLKGRFVLLIVLIDLYKANKLAKNL